MSRNGQNNNGSDISKKIKMSPEDVSLFEDHCAKMNITQKDAMHELVRLIKFKMEKPPRDWIMIPRIDFQYFLRTLDEKGLLEYADMLVIGMTDYTNKLGTFQDFKDILKEWTTSNQNSTWSDENNLLVWKHGVCKEFSQVFYSSFCVMFLREGFEVVWADISENQLAMKYVPKSNK